MENSNLVTVCKCMGTRKVHVPAISDWTRVYFLVPFTLEVREGAVRCVVMWKVCLNMKNAVDIMCGCWRPLKIKCVEQDGGVGKRAIVVGWVLEISLVHGSRRPLAAHVYQLCCHGKGIEQSFHVGWRERHVPSVVVSPLEVKCVFMQLEWVRKPRCR